ncbi:MAG: tetratricopeptide repeat protein [Nitrospirae bacterium]|nr:MAG: tetratricopeptide repeat protein [Nitrospirota bacterium]
MFKIKKTRKESPTDPAHLVDSVGQATRQARENFRWLLAGVAVAIIAGAAVGGFLWMRQQDERAAADLLHEATLNVTERSFMGGPPPVRQPEELKKAAAVLQQILTEFPRSAVAPQAAYLLGNVRGDLKDWEGAVREYQEFLARYGTHRALVPLVYQRLAYAQLAQGKVEEAEKTLTAVTKITGAPNKDQALFELGKIDEILKRPEGALAHYQEIVKDHPSSPFAAEASVRIKTLDARKASVPPAEPAASPAAPAK